MKSDLTLYVRHGPHILSIFRKTLWNQENFGHCSRDAPQICHWLPGTPHCVGDNAAIFRIHFKVDIFNSVVLTFFYWYFVTPAFCYLSVELFSTLALVLTKFLIWTMVYEFLHKFPSYQLFCNHIFLCSLFLVPVFQRLLQFHGS